MKTFSPFKFTAVAAGLLIAGVALTGCSASHTTATPTATTVAPPPQFAAAQASSGKAVTSFFNDLKSVDRNKIQQAFGPTIDSATGAVSSTAPTAQQQVTAVTKVAPKLVADFNLTGKNAQQQLQVLQIWITNPVTGDPSVKVKVTPSKFVILGDSSVNVPAEGLAVSSKSGPVSLPPLQLVKADGKWLVAN